MPFYLKNKLPTYTTHKNF